ncbi:C-type lectin-like [Tiliqua scincoides]|uniref:C-type lectin-like n=1 Tax=Tiliqua scincoides TaxID=71010 RepID=UPI003462494A
MHLLTSSALCLLGVLISSSFLGAEAESCDRDWLQNQGNCYAFFEDNTTWAEAEIQCQSYGQGAHLASILTEAETELVSEYINSFPNVKKNVWMGLRDFRRNRKWRWADGSVFNYKAWVKNEPNNAGGSEFCVELTHSSGFKEWNDAGCGNSDYYICKHEL